MVSILVSGLLRGPGMPIAEALARLLSKRKLP